MRENARSDMGDLRIAKEIVEMAQKWDFDHLDAA
jgi:hypothetical protein